MAATPKKKKEDWIKTKWRPMMAWAYMAICIFDFIIGPILRVWFMAYTGQIIEPWTSLTLSEGGMFHMSMGAIVGVSAWTRGQEKLTAMNNPVFHNNPDYVDTHQSPMDQIPEENGDNQNVG